MSQQESAEEYYIRRDGFLRHIKDNVDPARVASGLQPLDETTARECFRILNDFWAKLDQENEQHARRTSLSIGQVPSE